MTGGLWHGRPGAGNVGPVKVVNAVFVLLFALSAALQYNDPDPWRWVAMYLASAGAALLAMHRRHGWIAAFFVGVFAAVWSAILWADSAPHVSYADFVGKMSEKGGKVEVMREAGGLTIVAVWLAVVAMVGWRRDRGV